MRTQRTRWFRFAGAGSLAASLFSLVLGTVIVVSALQEENMLANAGFEEPDPANWESKDEGCPGLWSYYWSSSPVHSGNHSVGIGSKLSGHNGWWQSTPPVPITVTRPYTFSGWIKVEGVDNQAFLMLVFLDAQGSEIMTANSSIVNGSNDWVQVRPSESVIAPVDAVSARIRCQLVGKGIAWYDDIFLYPEPGDFANLELSKSAQPITVRAGGALTYTLRYSNTGNALAKDVVIVDTLPSGVTVAYLNPPADEQPAPHTLVWNIGDLAESSTPEAVTIAVRVSDFVADGEWLTNTATIVGEMAGLAEAWVATKVASSSVPYAVYLPFIVRNYARPFCNGDFETIAGGFASCWEREGNLSVTITTTLSNGGPCYSGMYCALLGSPSDQCSNLPIGHGQIHQTFGVPTGTPKLSFWYRIFSYDERRYDKDGSDRRDTFEVYIDGVCPNHTPPIRLLIDGSQDGKRGCEKIDLDITPWKKSPVFDLSAIPDGNGGSVDYRGQAVQLSFRLHSRELPEYTKAWYNTWVYVDDVRIEP